MIKVLRAQLTFSQLASNKWLTLRV